LLVAKAPDLELVPDQPFTFPPNVSFRGPEQLLVLVAGRGRIQVAAPARAP
jgi:hypothetical protein